MKWIEKIFKIINIVLSITIKKYLTNIIIKKRIPKLFFNFVLIFIIILIILILVLIIVILLFEQRNLIRKFDNIIYKEETGHLDIIIRLKLDNKCPTGYYQFNFQCYKNNYPLDTKEFPTNSYK